VAIERHLLEPILDGGIPNPHYFEGRVLTSTALFEDQEAHRTRQRRLGRALGAGVVDGLWVSIHSSGSATETPVVSVGCGLAINGRGQTMALPADERLALTEPKKDEAVVEALFHDCVPPSVGVESTGEGFYVLVMSPASGYRGKAPMSGLGKTKAGAGCGSRWAVEGVVLRLEPFDPLAVSGTTEATRNLLMTELLSATDDVSLSKLRNVVAHLCLGTEQATGFFADPFARDSVTGGGSEPATAHYGALDDLRQAGRIDECDVPLALLYWQLDGLRLVDSWSARRSLVSPATSDAWPALSRLRRRSEAKAAFFQFQDQIAERVAKAASPTALRATDNFRFLPAAGILPVTALGVRGIDALGFFTGVTTRSAVFMEGARLQPLLSDSFEHPPIDLTTGEMLWLYLVRQNRQVPANPPLLVFTSGHLPYRGDPEYDLAYWSYSNYGPGVAG